VEQKALPLARRVGEKRPRGSRSSSPEGKHTDSRGELVEADEGALLQCRAVLSEHSHDIGADSLGQDILSPDLNHTRASRRGVREDSGEVEVVSDHGKAVIARPCRDDGIGRGGFTRGTPMHRFEPALL
jgi:hypothetical protein